jgi:hypothetical protein
MLQPCFVFSERIGGGDARLPRRDRNAEACWLPQTRDPAHSLLHHPSTPHSIVGARAQG